jgi:hypothetical protein
MDNAVVIIIVIFFIILDNLLAKKSNAFSLNPSECIYKDIWYILTYGYVGFYHISLLYIVEI